MKDVFCTFHFKRLLSQRLLGTEQGGLREWGVWLCEDLWTEDWGLTVGVKGWTWDIRGEEWTPGIVQLARGVKLTCFSSQHRHDWAGGNLTSEANGERLDARRQNGGFGGGDQKLCCCADWDGSTMPPVRTGVAIAQRRPSTPQGPNLPLRFHIINGFQFRDILDGRQWSTRRQVNMKSLHGDTQKPLSKFAADTEPTFPGCPVRLQPGRLVQA